VCPSEATTHGIPSCAAQPFFEATRRFDAGTQASFAFTAPELVEGSRFLALLVACQQGRARFAQDGSGHCTGGTEPREATFEGTVEEANANPSLADDELELDGDRWQDAPLLSTGASCRDDDLPKVRAAKKSEIAFALRGDDRQSLPRNVVDHYGSERTEALAYSHFLTEPGLERPFSGIAASSADTRFELSIELAHDLPPRGAVADFHLVVRDDRGGADWIRRQLCALP
jgi:hypothetical protein